VAREVFGKLFSHQDRQCSGMDTRRSPEAHPSQPEQAELAELADRLRFSDRPTHRDNAKRATLEDRLRIVSWIDPLVDDLGHDPRSSYVEHFWLPVLGPTSLWLLRNIACSLDFNPQGSSLDLERTARQIGLGGHLGRHGPFRRAISRLCAFDLARFTAPRELAVRRFVPPLGRRHLMRLDPAAQEQHRLWLDGESRTDPSVTRLRWRARRLALGLVSLGDDYATVELELLGWHLHPALASDAASWAWHRSDRRSPELPGP
jgi:hypothetical protein